MNTDPNPERFKLAYATAWNLGSLVASGDVHLTGTAPSYPPGVRIRAVTLAIDLAGGCKADTIHGDSYGACRWDDYRDQLYAAYDEGARHADRTAVAALYGPR